MPLHVLHLLDPGAAGDQPLRHCAWLRANDAANAHTPLLIGGGPAERRAALFGLPDHDRLHPPFRNGVLATRPLRRFTSERGPFDLIHAWSAESLIAAASLGIPVVATLLHTPEAPSASRPRMLLRRAAARASRIVCPSEHVAAAWSRRLGDDANIVVEPDAVTLEYNMGVRQAVRDDWDVGDETFTLIAAAAPETRINARLLVHIISIVAVTGHTLCLVLPSRARDVERARRYTLSYCGRWHLIIDDSPLETLLPAGDAVIWAHPATGPEAHRSPPGVSLIEAAATHGVPVVAMRHHVTAPYVGAPVKGLAGDEVIQMVGRLTDVAEGAAGDEPEQTAFARRHDPTAWLNRMNAHWSEAAKGAAVRV